MINYSPQTATIDIDRATQFTGDDVDRFSSLVDLQNVCSKALVYIPARDSATVTVYIQRDGLVATVPVAVSIFDDDATGHFAHATTAGTGAIAIVFHLGGAQYLRIYTGANQTADRALTVIGIRD